MPLDLEACMKQHSEDDLKETVSEPRVLLPNSYTGKVIAVFTSGGDAQGMNSAVRAVVRVGIYLGCKVFFIKEGYQGMVDGGDNIVEASWSSVSGIINKGGTVIGSARCSQFREKAGRLVAAKNLIDRSITNLVVIGGDGSLTGANQFRNEWPELLAELRDQKLISVEQAEQHSILNIVGIVGSIDNDFCGTDMTIGTDTALRRIVEAVDCIIPTAYSHKRTFIMEVMGRHCGYLALVAAIVTEADFVFIPEFPPVVNWPEKLCKKLTEARDSGQRLNIILVAEGAIDREGRAITAQQIQKVCVDKLNQDTRITVLGHVQRGGSPSAFDRILGCRMGAEAVLALMDATPESEAVVVSLDGNSAVRVPLMDCVRKTQDVAKAMASKNWELAVQLRGRSFKRNLETYLRLTLNRPRHLEVFEGKTRLNFGVLHVGAPSCGMNAAVRSFVRNCIIAGHFPYGVNNGVEGLVTGDIRPLTWNIVNGWAPAGGAKLGTKRTLPSGKYEAIANSLAAKNIHGLLLIGGFEAYHTALLLAENRSKFPEFKIPIIILPATISNNVPGTDFSLGCDTALNEISEICDKIRQSAAGTKRRVFIIEVMGGYSGYLATMAGLAGGSDTAYIHEEKFGVKDIMNDLEILKSKMERGNIERGLILNNEKASKEYNSEFLARVYGEEGKGVFTVRHNVLGHMQQGGSPSPFDRNLATDLAGTAFRWLAEKAGDNLTEDGLVVTGDKDSAVLLGLRKRVKQFLPVQKLKEETDFELRRANSQWWMEMRPMMKILARHDSTYAMPKPTTSVDLNGHV